MEDLEDQMKNRRTEQSEGHWIKPTIKSKVIKSRENLLLKKVKIEIHIL